MMLKSLSISVRATLVAVGVFALLGIQTAGASPSTSFTVSMTPSSQTIAAGTTAHYKANTTAYYYGPFTYTMSWGDGSAPYTFTSAVPYNSNSGVNLNLSHAFTTPCTARVFYYTQTLTVTNSAGYRTSVHTKTTVTYSGPLCSLN